MKNLHTFEEFVNESVNETSNIVKLILRKIGWAGETFTPQELASQIKKLDDSTLIAWSKDNKGIPNTPLAFQMRLVNTEMKKRGLSESVNETAMPAFVKTAIKELAHSMPNHTKPDSDGNFNDVQIKAAIMKYSPVLKQAFKNGLESDIIEEVKEIINESLNEAAVYATLKTVKLKMPNIPELSDMWDNGKKYAVNNLVKKVKETKAKIEDAYNKEQSTYDRPDKIDAMKHDLVQLRYYIKDISDHLNNY